MKSKLILALAALALLSTLNTRLSALFAQGTAFTYQGRLNRDGTAANGIYDLQFSLYDALVNGNTIGTVVASNAITVSNGLFTVTVDPGAGVFDGGGRWLEVAVRTNGGGAFTSLNPRQPL